MRKWLALGGLVYALGCVTTAVTALAGGWGLLCAGVVVGAVALVVVDWEESA